MKLNEDLEEGESWYGQIIVGSTGRHEKPLSP